MEKLLCVMFLVVLFSYYVKNIVDKVGPNSTLNLNHSTSSSGTTRKGKKENG